MLLFVMVVCQPQFTSSYSGDQVTGVLGSSVNFSWTFRGNVASIQWGTKKDGVIGFTDTLVSLDKLSTVVTIQHSPYSGRVSGLWDGSSPGQVTFTLNSTRMEDEKFYICKLSEGSLDGQDDYDTVKLLVLGKLPKIK